MSSNDRIEALRHQWATDSRWKNVVRRYKAEDVVRIQGSVVVEHTLAQLGAQRFWKLLHEEDPTTALGAVTGNQAVQAARAGLKAIY